MSLKQSHSYGIISKNNNLNNNISKKISKKNRSIIYRPSNQSVKFLFNNFEVFKF
jgi:hypothetical protein